MHQGAKTGLCIVPTSQLARELKATEGLLFEKLFLILDMVEALSQDFDILVLDLGPGLSQIERCGILAVHEVITPILAEYFSIDGLQGSISAIQSISQAYRRSLAHKRVILNALNLFYAGHKSILPAISDLGYELSVVPQDRSLADAQTMHVPLRLHTSKARALPAIHQLACDLVLSLQDGVA